MPIIGTPTSSAPVAPGGPPDLAPSRAARVSDIANRIMTLLGSDPSLTHDEVQSLLQTRYEHIYEVWTWSKRVRDFSLSLVAQVTSSTATTLSVTNGSATVISDGTPFTTAMNGRELKIGAERQYFFVRYGSSSTLVLQDGAGHDFAWPGETSLGQSWQISKTRYTLPADADSLISLTGTYPMEELDGGRERLDAMDPDRISTNNHPTYWLYAGADRLTAAREIEVWPVPTQARLLRGQYHRRAPNLTPDFIVDIPAPLLVYAGAADACHMLHAKQGSEEIMWENKALFFERKAEEVSKDFKIVDFEMTSPPTHLRRSSMDRRAQFRGTDYEVSHQLEST